MRSICIAAMLLLLAVDPALADRVPAAVTRDPPPDKAHPARMAVIHVQSGDAVLNGVVYIAQGPGLHPTLLFCHGLPGNEKSLDLAHAVRRAGWNAVTFNYRGSWGSGGSFAFAQTPDDARAVLAYLRDPANASRLAVDRKRLVLAGHSMGGWVTAETAAGDPDLLGAIMISAWDIGTYSDPAVTSRQTVLDFMDDDKETLVGVTAQSMTEEVLAHRTEWRLPPLAAGLKDRNLLLLSSSQEGWAGFSTALKQAIEAEGGHQVTQIIVDTDHVWSDHRIALASLVINWLDRLVKP